jgi:hypothetical protein
MMGRRPPGGYRTVHGDNLVLYSGLLRPSHEGVSTSEKCIARRLTGKPGCMAPPLCG